MKAPGTWVRLTPQRRKVWEVLCESHDHPTAVQVYERVRRENCAISFATVYNTLNYLKSLGLIQELKMDREASRYDARQEPHAHLFCLRCETLVDLELKATPDHPLLSGWKIVRVDLTYEGYCPRCQEQREAETRSSA